MTRDEALDDLRELERRLRSAEVQALYRARGQQERRRLAAQRAELSLLIARLTTAELDRVVAGLDALGSELERGVVDVRARLTTLDRPAAALNALARLLGVVARLAVLTG